MKEGSPQATKCRVLEFAPWKYLEGDEVRRALLAAVLFFLAEDQTKENPVKQCTNFLLRIVVDTLKVFKVSAGSQQTPRLEADFGKAITSFNESWTSVFSPGSAYENVMEAAFKDALNEALGNQSRLVLLIDDLDRCMPDVALAVLETLKLYLNCPNVVTLLGVDKSVINMVVYKRYRDMAGEDEWKLNPEIRSKASQYLDKMFQAEVSIEPDEAKVSEFLKEHLEKLDWWKSDLEERSREKIQGILDKLSRLTPRSVKRLVNAALVAQAGQVNKDQVTEAVCKEIIRIIVDTRPELSGTCREVLRREAGKRFLKAWADAIKVGSVSLPADFASPETGVSDDQGSAAPPKFPDSYIHFEPIWRNPEFADFRPLLENNDIGILVKTGILPTEDVNAAQSSAQATAQATQQAAPQIQPMSLSSLASSQTRHLSQASGRAQSDITEDFLKTLERLDFRDSGLRDDELNLFGIIQSLKYLDLRGCSITGAGLASFAGHPNLQTLYLSNTPVRDEHMAFLSELGNLTDLRLSMTSIGDAGVAHLSWLPKLAKLALIGTPLTGAGLKELAKIHSLEHLDLESTRITGPDIMELKDLPNLKSVDISGIAVSAETLDEFRKYRADNNLPPVTFAGV